jgi:hypothetical protein
MKMLLRHFNGLVGRDGIFKPTIGNESLHETSNDNGARIVNFATYKNFTIKSTMFDTVTFMNILGRRLQM